MTKTFLNAITILLLTMNVALAESGQAGDESVAANAAGAATEAPVETPAWLKVVMDGSSFEAFSESMEQVREVGGDDAYERISASFKNLLFLDIGARNNKEILASRLDGMTSGQVIAKAGYVKN